MSPALHPAAPQHLPGFITAPGDTDVLMIVVGIILIASIIAVGNFYFKLHSLPERMAHKSKKLQFEIVAVLGLLSLFTHNHLFWILGLLLALIDLPDFLGPLRSMAASARKIAGLPPEAVDETTDVAHGHGEPDAKADLAISKADAASSKADTAIIKADAAKAELANSKAELTNREVPRHA